MGSTHVPDRNDLHGADTPFTDHAVAPSDRKRMPTLKHLFEGTHFLTSEPVTRVEKHTKRMLPGMPETTEPVAPRAFVDFDEGASGQTNPALFVNEKWGEANKTQVSRGLDIEIAKRTIHDIFTSKIDPLVSALIAQGVLTLSKIQIGPRTTSHTNPLSISYGKRAATFTVQRPSPYRTFYLIKVDEGSIDRQGHNHILFNIEGSAEAPQLFFAIYGPDSSQNTLNVLINTEPSPSSNSKESLHPAYVAKMRQGAEVIERELQTALAMATHPDIETHSAVPHDSPVDVIQGSSHIQEKIDAVLSEAQITEPQSGFDKKNTAAQLTKFSELIRAFEKNSVAAKDILSPSDETLYLNLVATSMHMLSHVVPTALAELERRRVTGPLTILYEGYPVSLSREASHGGGEYYVIDIPESIKAAAQQIIVSPHCSNPHVSNGIYFAYNTGEGEPADCVFDCSLSEVSVSNSKEVLALSKVVFNLSEGICGIIHSS